MDTMGMSCSLAKNIGVHNNIYLPAGWHFLSKTEQTKQNPKQNRPEVKRLEKQMLNKLFMDIQDGYNINKKYKVLLRI